MKATTRPGQLRDGALLIAGVALTVWAFDDLARAFGVLTGGDNRMAAVDLRMRMFEVGGWFRGEPIYRTDANAVYPPAAYGVIATLAGGLDFERARRLWAVQSLILLVAGAAGVVWASRAEGLTQRLAALLVLPSLAAVSPGVANGQLHLITVLAAVAAVLLLSPRAPSWPRELAGAALMLVALTKPTIGVPFFVLVWVLPGRLRPGILVLVLYGLATAVALLPQPEGSFVLLTRWIDRAVSGAEFGAHGGGTSNAQSLLTRSGIEGWSTMVAVGMIALLGEFALRRRAADVFVLLGAAGLVARLCVYHRSYDDLLALPALVALLRIAWGIGETRPTMRGVALLAFAGGLAVGSVPEPLVGHSDWFQPVQSAVWLAMLLVLWIAGHRRAAPAE